MEVFVCLPVDGMWNGGTDLQAGVEIHHLGYPRFWLILSSQNDPCLGPEISAPRVVSWRFHTSLPMRTPDPISGCALRYGLQVLRPVLWAMGLALTGRAARGNDSNFGDFGIMTPRGEPVAP